MSHGKWAHTACLPMCVSGCMCDCPGIALVIRSKTCLKIIRPVRRWKRITCFSFWSQVTEPREEDDMPEKECFDAELRL